MLHEWFYEVFQLGKFVGEYGIAAGVYAQLAVLFIDGVDDMSQGKVRVHEVDSFFYCFSIRVGQVHGNPPGIPDSDEFEVVVSRYI